MKRDRALPFRTLNEAAFKMTPWAYSLNGAEPQYNPAQMANWDYASDLQVWRRVEVDFAEAARCLEISEDELSIQVRVSLGTGPGSVPRWTSQAESVVLSKNAAVKEIRLSVNSRELSTRIMLSTDLLLAAGHNSASPLSPSSVGARLWRDDRGLAKQAKRISSDQTG